MKCLSDLAPELVCCIISEKAGLEGFTHFNQSCSVDIHLSEEAVKDAVPHEGTLIEPLALIQRLELGAYSGDYLMSLRDLSA